MSGPDEQPGAERVAFLLNENWTAADPGTILLEHLRDSAGLTGAKPGCNTGDCASCLVLVGTPSGDSAALQYQAVNSCLTLVAQVDRSHVITIEGLSGTKLTPVQQALVDAGAVQCGYCTPGLVIAMTAGLLQGADPAHAASGNLCRCTGYAAIRDAAQRAAAAASSAATGAGVVPEALLARGVAELAASVRLPPGLDGLATGVPIGGATDWSPTHRHSPRMASPALLLRRFPELREIRASDTGLRVGAAATVAELAASRDVAAQWPELRGYLELFASPSIQNMATVGGNLANGSPSADLAVLLLAMGAHLSLLLPSSGRTRQLELAQFHLGYKVLALEPGELITSIDIPARRPGYVLAFDKVARRRTDDVAAVNLASLGLPSPDGGIADLVLAAGGVAATPKVLATPADLLVGRTLTPATFREAALALSDVIAPIDDLHGSAAYRRRLLRHLIAGQLAGLVPGFQPLVALAGCLT